MLTFPSQSLMDEQACYAYLLKVWHPQGLPCPQGHPLAAAQGAHDRHRAPLLDYRCTTCGAVFNLLTGTLWSKTRSSCATMVLMLRGVAPGVPTAHLAGELGLDRAHLLEHRHEMQPLSEPRVPPEPPARGGDGGR
jgi:transposase-like protein